MSSASVLQVGRFGWATFVAAWFSCAHFALGQSAPENTVPKGLLGILGLSSPTDSTDENSYQQPANTPRHGQLARLIENPDQTEGAPPYALTDQMGAVQRYVEPVPGIDLETHVGQVVVVRHDTGNTLLASQLELPPAQFRPMVGYSDNDRYAVRTGLAGTGPAGTWRRMDDSSRTVEQAQYIDRDDSSVQLLPDDVSMGGSPPGPGGLAPFEGMPPGGNPVFLDQMGQPGMQGPMIGPQCGPGYGPPYGPMQYGPGPMMYPNQMYPNQMVGPYPQCGPVCKEVKPERPHFTADVELSWLRPNWSENAIGKVSEEYQFSPRAILAFRGIGNLDGRVRYWHYDQESDILGTDDEIGIRFNVFDIEMLHRFCGRRSELTLAAGVRFAGIELTDMEDEDSSADLIGLTLAADGLTPLGKFPGGHFGLVYGGRLSILTGDWGGDDFSDFVDSQVRNDNMLVHELYGGVELARCFRSVNVHARLLYEMQNWKSDVLAEDADIDSIGFFGPGVQLGAEF